MQLKNWLPAVRAKTFAEFETLVKANGCTKVIARPGVDAPDFGPGMVSYDATYKTIRSDGRRIEFYEGMGAMIFLPSEGESWRTRERHNFQGQVTIAHRLMHLKEELKVNVCIETPSETFDIEKIVEIIEKAKTANIEPLPIKE